MYVGGIPWKWGSVEGRLQQMFCFRAGGCDALEETGGRDLVELAVKVCR